VKLAEVLLAVWQQTLVDDRSEVDVGGQPVRVTRSRGQGLRIVVVPVLGHTIEGIEQNPNTSSRWAQLAQEGKRIMQFKAQSRYFANVCEGKVTRYPAWTSLGLPD
jgi:hypothetical protein